ncbi:MAG: iron-containing alcohol dehydrogenase family protein [Armatimonadota bacterium]
MPEFRLPAVIHFGWGALEKLRTEAPQHGRRALLVTGRSAMKRTGIADRVASLLAAGDVDVIGFSDVESDPSSATIDRATDLAREERCDLVIGLGGGSPMDTARAVAGMVGLEGSVLDYVRGKAIDRPGLPLVNIATTSGTASEITQVAVVLDEERHIKIGMRSPFWFARVAITDPELTLSMPPRVTAGTGLDALTHAAESYMSTGATPPAEALALHAVALVGQHLRAAVADGSNRAAREGMAMASMIAGMAFANTGLGLAHGIAHPVGARYRVPHGECCGRLLPHVMRHNAAAVPERVAAIGQALTGRQVTDPEQAAAAVESLLRDVGVSPGLADVGMPESEIQDVAKDTMLVGAIRTNPRPVTVADALSVLEVAAKAR